MANSAESFWKVLLVDDDQDDSILIRCLLEDRKGDQFILSWCQTAGEVLEAADANNFDVYLVDYKLNGDSGLDVLVALREAHPTIPSILLTGYPGYELKETAKKLGVDAFLSKADLDKDILAWTIEKVIRSRSEY